MRVVTDFNPLKNYLVVTDFSDTPITLESFRPFQRAGNVRQASFEEAMAYVVGLTKAIAKETTIALPTAMKLSSIPTEGTMVCPSMTAS